MKKSWIAAGIGMLVLGVAVAQAAETKGDAKAAAKPAAAPAATVVAPKVKGALSKEESLQLMNLQYTIAIAENNYVQLVTRINERAAFLQVKYLTKEQRGEYTFDPNAIKFVPNADVKKAQEEAKAANKTEIRLPENVKFIEVDRDDSLAFQSLIYAIGQVRSDLSQLYNKRQEMVNKLMEKNNFKLDTTDIDVMTGTFIEVPKKEEPKKEAKAPAAP